MKARSIGKAIDTYYVDHGRYPESLDALLQKSELGKGPYLTNRNEVFDPWGQLYTYDQSGRINSEAGSTVTIPDVYTKTPDGRTIGNFSDSKK